MQPPEQHSTQNALRTPAASERGSLPEPVELPSAFVQQLRIPRAELHGRLIAMGQRARNGASAFGLYFIVPGAFVGLFADLLIAMAPLGFALPMAGIIGCGIGGFFLGRHLMLLRFERAYHSAMGTLLSTDLPVLIADEEYCRSILSAVREQGRFMLTGPPSIASLEDQLEFAASYFQALQHYRLLVENPASPLLRGGGSRHQSVSSGARAGYLLASFATCCFGIFTIPVLLSLLWRAVDQRGTLCAICDYFGGRFDQ